MNRIIAYGLSLLFLAVCFPALFFEPVEAISRISGTVVLSNATFSDSSNANIEAVTGINGKTIRVFGYKLGVNSNDSVTVRCGSVLKDSTDLSLNAGVVVRLWPAYLECRPQSANLTGTVSTLDDDVTFTVNATTDVITLSATTSIVAGHPLVFKSTSALPGGLSSGTTYYYGLGTGKLYTTSASGIADDGSTNLVDITSTGTGTHSLDGRYVHGSATATFSTDFGALDRITVGGQTFTVSSVTSATKLVLTAANTADSASGQSYKRGADSVWVSKSASTALKGFITYEQDID